MSSFLNAFVVAVESLCMALGFTRTFSQKSTVHFSGVLSLPSFSSPVPLAHFTVHFHFPVVGTYVILCIYSKHRTHKRRDVLQYRSFWDLVSLETLSASHISIMNFSHFYTHFALISLCSLYDNLHLSPLFSKWHNFILCGWVKSHCVHRHHFLFICSPGSINNLALLNSP